MPAARQISLFGGGAPAVDAAVFERLRLGQARTTLPALGAGPGQPPQPSDVAWYDHAPGVVSGHEALLEHLVATTRWRQERMEIYDRTVDVPRLVAALPEDGPGHPLLDELRARLEACYGCAFPHVTLGYYRSGDDSVAWHGDRVARNMPGALVATVSLGEPRRFLLRPHPAAGASPAPPGRSRALMLGWGDLLVMGGSCQRTWQHAVPKVARAQPRLAVMFRPAWYPGLAGYAGARRRPTEQR